LKKAEEKKLIFQERREKEINCAKRTDANEKLLNNKLNQKSTSADKKKMKEDEQ